MLKIRRSWDRLVFNMRILVLVRRHIYTATINRKMGKFPCDGVFRPYSFLKANYRTSLSDPIRFLERLLHVFFPKSQNYLGIKFRKFTECGQINYWHELVELYIFSWPRTRLSYSSPRPFELKVFFRHSSAVIMLYTTFHSFNNAPSLCISHLQFIGTHVWYLNDSYPVATFMSRYTYIHIYIYIHILN